MCPYQETQGTRQYVYLSTTKEMNQQDESDAKQYRPGELLSCNNVEPVNPKSFEGYIQSFIWRDTSTKRKFFHSDKEASEDVYLEGLESTRLYYKRHGIKIKVIRSYDFTTFKSRKVRAYYAKYGIQHTLPTLAELSREGHSYDDPQYIGGIARINTHASRLVKQSTQALDQGPQ